MASADAALSWTSLADHLDTLFDHLLPLERQRRLPLEEQYALGVVRRAIAGLPALDDSGTGPSLAAAEEALTVELEAALPRVGRFGDGILVAPITHAIGLDLDVVFVVGMSEDLYPGRVHEDSLLPDRVRERTDGQLPTTRDRVHRQRRAFLAALDAAPRAVVSFPRGDLRQHVRRLPSRWLLPSLRALAGDPHLAATKWESGVRHLEAVDSSPSFAASVTRAPEPGTEQEWRLRALSAGQALDDDTLAAARTMLTARSSPRFTRFDGRLTGVPGLPHLGDGTGVVSPTSLERYATCPHEYFVSRLLRVRPIEEPERTIEISALDTGSLIHECFDALITEAAAAGDLPGYGRPWSEAQRVRLQEILGDLADQYEAEGRTGHPTLWARHRLRISQALDWMITDDNAWRAEQDARVLASELTFGNGGTDPVQLDIGDGRTVLFRGSADKVDERRDGTLLVTDIKTGSRRTFTGLGEDDPVAGGEKLQLPVYALAAQTAFGGAEAPPVEALYWFVRKDRGRIALPLTPAVRQRYAATVRLLVDSIAAGLFPQRAPEQPDFAWVQCPYCNPDGIGHAAIRARWEALRLEPELRPLTALLEPEDLPDDT